RRDVQPDLHGAEVGLDQLDAVGEQQGDGVTGLQPEAAQPVGDLVGPVEQVAGGALGAVGAHQRQSVSVVFGESPESQVSHGGTLRENWNVFYPAGSQAVGRPTGCAPTLVAGMVVGQPRLQREWMSARW